MSKVEQQAVNAMRQGVPFKSRNTRVDVQILDGEQIASLYLHGHLLATLDRWNDCLRLTDAQYRTVTTKSRLNAILSAFVPACYIQQVKGVWWLQQGGQRILWEGTHGFTVPA